MGKARVLLFGVSIAVLLIAYALNDPIPDGISQPWIAKISLGIIKFIRCMSKCLGTLGFNEPVMFRKQFDFLAKLTSPHKDADVSMEDMIFNGVPVRVYTPPGDGKEKRRGLVFYHGGGWSFLNLDAYDSQMTQFSKELDAIVVSVDFRLAPENVFPAAAYDCEKATKHFINNAATFGVDSSRIAVAGDSAGGNLAAVVPLRLRNSGFKLMPKLQVLIYPVLQGMNFDTPSYRANQNGPLITKNSMIYFAACYLFGDDLKEYVDEMYTNNHTTSAIKKSNAKTFLNIEILPDDNLRKNYKEHLDFGNTHLWNKMQKKFMNPDFAPLLAKDHSRLPKAYISTCQHDVLRDDGYFYAKRLRDAKVEVTHVNVDPCYHGWIGAHKDIDTFREEFTKIVTFIRNNL